MDKNNGIRAQIRAHRWTILGSLLALSFVLGYWGLHVYFVREGSPQRWHNLLYLTFQIYPFNLPLMADSLPWQLQVARFLGPFLVAYSAVAAGLALFQDQVQRVRARRAKGHTIVCGLGAKGRLLTASLIAHGKSVVAIEQEESNPAVRDFRHSGAIVIVGDATSTDHLRNAGISHARHVFAVCGDDGTNAEIANRVRDVITVQFGSAISCIAHITVPSLAGQLQETEITGQEQDRFRLEFFNVFESGAQFLIESDKFSPFHGSNAPSGVHVLIVGLGHFGECVVVEIAREFRKRYKDIGERLTLTLVDGNATERWKILTHRFRSLAKYCEVILYDFDVTSSSFAECGFMQETNGHKAVSHAYVCLQDESLGIASALRLSEASRDCSVVACSSEDAGLGMLMQAEVDRIGQPKNLTVFGLLNATCTSDLRHAGKIETMARAAHENYCEQQKQDGQTVESNSSIVDWAELSEEFRESNRQQVEHIPVKLAAFDYSIRMRRDWDKALQKFSRDEIEGMAILEHDRWQEERFSAKWQHVPKRKKDQIRKTSPDLVSWDELNDKAKEKDRAAVAGLPRFLEDVGFEVYKVKNS